MLEAGQTPNVSIVRFELGQRSQICRVKGPLQATHRHPHFMLQIGVGEQTGGHSRFRFRLDADAPFHQVGELFVDGVFAEGVVHHAQPVEVR